MQDETPEIQSPQRDFLKEIVDFFKDLIVIVAIVLCIRTFLIMPFQINGQSMYDSYYDGEFIIVDRFSYRDFPIIGKYKDVQRGDVVVFKPGVNQDKKYFIKRVIGLPEDTIKIEAGKVYLQVKSMGDFVELKEAYLDAANNGKTYVSSSSALYIYKVPEGEYFVMGDNRNASTDSRTCFSRCDNRSNYINFSNITGKIFLDLGYFSFRTLSFSHPKILTEQGAISTIPRFFSSPAVFDYDL